jgi:hypothetical protein
MPVAKQQRKPSPPPPKENLASNDWSDPINDRGDYFKPEYGSKYRIHLLRVPYGKRMHYVQGVGFIHSDSQWSEDNKKCEERGELDNYIAKDPDMRYLAPIVVYQTDQKGQTSGPASKVSFTIQIWSMPKTAYQQLFDLSIEWGKALFEQDLILTVDKKGTMVFIDTITVASKGALSNDASLGKFIKAEYDEDKFQNVELLDKMLGQTLTLEEFTSKLDGADDSEGSGRKPGGARRGRNPNNL